jgi:hypothetical protein
MKISPWLLLPDLIGEGPGPRAAHSCELINDKLFFFGGWNGKKALNDIYILDLENCNW